MQGSFVVNTHTLLTYTSFSFSNLRAAFEHCFGTCVDTPLVPVSNLDNAGCASFGTCVEPLSFLARESSSLNSSPNSFWRFPSFSETT